MVATVSAYGNHNAKEEHFFTPHSLHDESKIAKTAPNQKKKKKSI